MDALQSLLLERDLARVLARYAQICDQRLWGSLGDVFTSDATARYGPMPLANPLAIEQMLRNHLGGCGPSQHLLGNLMVDTRDGHVHSTTTIRAAHRGAGEQAQQVYECLGEYHDQWRHTQAGWRISARQMVVVMEIGSRKVLSAQRPAA